MTNSVRSMLNTMRRREYRKERVSYFWDLPGFWELDEYEQSTVVMEEMLKRQQPLIFAQDIFGFNRYLIDRPGEDANSHAVIDGQKFYERYSNITYAFELIIDRGINSLLRQLHTQLSSAQGEQIRFCQACIRQLNAVLDISARYRDAAKEAGNIRLYEALCQVPMEKPRSFYEALLFQKLLVFVLRCSFYKHVTLGRFDQYMYPYYLADKAAGKTEQELLEELELYFISLNMDSDLYPGIQQGDNGQSMVLGGYDLAGNFQFNALSQLCLEASLELSLIDPKINLRVNKNTPDSIYALGTKLTKQGLGFPQYCNDDIIVPGLIKLGYRPEDAVNYTVAACWEPIIPGFGADIPNKSVYSFPVELSNAIASLETCDSMETLWAAFDHATAQRCSLLQNMNGQPDHCYFKRPQPVSPLGSLMMYGCLESMKDVGRFGARYYNFGSFGAGLSTAADSMAAIKQLVFTEKTVDWATLKAALNADFEGYKELRNQLMNCPKLGGNDTSLDAIAQRLMGIFIKHMNGKPNNHGGVWRCGTGSAQNYIFDAKKCPATADGRKAGQPYACSFSPAPGAKTAGPLSVIRAFTAMDLTDCVNGGPLTMELHQNVFRNAEGESKVAQLVKLFILSGGHQLQLNALNREPLLDAQRNPQAHRDLVVRVWGWSGYFCELDPEFQDHILSRTEYTV